MRRPSRSRPLSWRPWAAALGHPGPGATRPAPGGRRAPRHPPRVDVDPRHLVITAGASAALLLVAVLVAGPAKATGTSVPAAELAALCDLNRERGAWLMVDETYLDLADPVFLPDDGDDNDDNDDIDDGNLLGRRAQH